MSVPCSVSPLLGLWQPQARLNHLYYGPSCVQTHLLSTLPSQTSKVFIVTTTSLSTKTPLINNLETLLTPAHHAGTFPSIHQHGPESDIDAATALVLSNPEIDTILSLGGGSPIDAAKTISYRVHQARGKFLTHVTIPTTLSAAECTAGGGYTDHQGVKRGFMAPEMGVSAIFYDPFFARYTPMDLWLSTGIRALDHAVECSYHPYASEMPWKALARWAVEVLFEELPRMKMFSLQNGDRERKEEEEDDDERDEVMTRLQLAAFASSGLKGGNFKGGMGLSHSLGHALGSPYGIPHGITSCLTLGKVVKLKAVSSGEDARQIARLLPAMGGRKDTRGEYREDALEVGDRIMALVESLGLKQGSLLEIGVSKDEIPVIVERATGGLKALKDEKTYNSVYALVESLF